MFNKAALVAFSFLAMVCGQQVGTLTAETHPALPWELCTTAGGCVTQSSGKVVLDSNWRWLHSTSGSTNCYTGNTWDATLCPDGVTCAANCALDGADYEGTYGITASGNALTLKFVTDSAQKNVGSRVYLMASDTEYELFKVLNQEFTFDVDVSNLPCGLNGALYFSQMDADGGLSKFPGNKAGAKYGTGYCDSQCPRDIKFINGVANSVGWDASANDANAGTGQFGTCCNEMDVWEANNNAAAFTPHPCTVSGQTRCDSTADDGCGTTDRYNSVCDPDGCDFNSFRMGNTTFYGAGMTVDTTKKFTVVTQFITDDGTATGTLSEIRRIYVQDGVVIQNSNVNIPGLSPTINSITTDYCTDQVTVFDDTPSFSDKGGLAAISTGMAAGMVLVLSVWDDYAVNMLWLDSDYPTTSDPSSPGVARGSCPTTSGVPATIETTEANASVTYSNIKFGDIGSTFSAGSGTGSPGTTTAPAPTTTVTPPTTPTTTANGATQTKYGQCGGLGFTGPTVCAAGSTCQVSNAYYSQCL
ncbi:carbohydrate-binding module family 1 protein [Hypholoma sublateritium FD-334 SS-4]|uniref:Glucanase n=1 Tax=Hypholoma sublateritium (strain FD-334 SS-4) TaxID=945553 RepID=A0A0D2P9Q1_HYPSF|nr:carbohydrate-binding module family 1 protein [Hypholoma sublateritium FD-334 SS-4]